MAVSFMCVKLDASGEGSARYNFFTLHRLSLTPQATVVPSTVRSKDVEASDTGSDGYSLLQL